mmetsp:Transcript_19704/g.38545  ORF Transcript_19704/g.38545 Transcript_19704/m.38545 type:complete len:239 (-) Transcript_19704:2800-3516(-)|eukprot:CAMPEP_0171494580 /NCGR_PEP_ID=MMETSP0958-20121227/5637_1 /TAXON_ID=87120 /ORGANISM="Aurantiochytrium limacinum, Strain ATCCMYA-1381" /LENGTH=238 /DNA_ID=CAMNT_0012028411 /DNA_START=165 /DNA_END=881 /DNA_ORIENTATION=+
MQRRVLVVGGAGALGTAVVKRFFAAGQWEVASLDKIAAKTEVHRDIGEIVKREVALGASWNDEFEVARAYVNEWASKGNVGLDAVVHVAGGFAMGGIKDGVQPVQKMWEMNAQSAFTAAALAAECLGPQGLLVLTGAQAARKAGGTGFAAGYGMSKAATHQLAMDFANDFCYNSQRNCRCILPGTIDTPANREAMPNINHSAWTSPEAIADRIFAWAQPEAFDSAEPQDLYKNLFVEV